MKVFKLFLSVIVSLILIAVGFGVGFAYRVFIEDAPISETMPTEDETGGSQDDQPSVIVEGDISIHFMELGNKYTGDSIFIQCGDNDILIDAGSQNSSATTIINYVDQYVTDNTLEYVIATHGHEDHIGAFYSTSTREGIFEHYVVENIIDFPLTSKTDDEITERSVIGRYYSAREEEIANGANHWTALECYNSVNGASRVIQLSDNVELEILYNYYYEVRDTSGENNHSVCVMINQGDNHYLFTGDLEAEGEERLVDFYEENYGGLPHCILYKAGHHGSYTSSTDSLMQAITPEYVVVCCCAGTAEYTDDPARQFPSQDFIDRVSPFTDKVYVTSVVDNYSDSMSDTTVKSMNGNIIFTVTDGVISLEFSGHDLKLKDTDWFKENRDCPLAWQT